MHDCTCSSYVKHLLPQITSMCCAICACTRTQSAAHVFFVTGLDGRLAWDGSPYPRGGLQNVVCKEVESFPSESQASGLRNLL